MDERDERRDPAPANQRLSNKKFLDEYYASRRHTQRNKCLEEQRELELRTQEEHRKFHQPMTLAHGLSASDYSQMLKPKLDDAPIIDNVTFIGESV